MKLFKNIIKYFVTSILALIIILSLYTFISISVFKKSYTNVFGYSYFVIASGSMSPAIEVNDLIIIKLDDTYKKNDIVTYKSGDSFVTHRVVEIGEENVILKGDANNTTDETVNKEDIIGRVKVIISSSTLIKVLGVIILVFIIVSIVNFDEIFKKYIKLENKKKSVSPLEYTQTIPIITEEVLVESMMDDTMRYDSLDQIINQFKQFKYTDKSAKEVEENKRKNKKIIKDVLNVLKLNSGKSKLTTDGAIKLKYLYELQNLCLKNPNKVNKFIENVPFEELYNYDFNEIGFTDKIRNALYEMPIYVYFILLIYSIIYDNEFYFDAVFKILKYRIKIEKDIDFIKDSYRVDKCITLVESIASKCKNNNFELEKIKEIIDLNKDL